MELRSWPPQIYTVPELAGATVPALVAGPPAVPGATAAIEFKWPRPQFCEGLIVLPLGDVLGVREEMAKLSIEVLDSKMRQIISDGRGQEIGLLLPFGLPALAAVGFGLRPFALQRPVANNDVWTVTIKNRHTAAINLAAVGFYVRQGLDMRGPS